MGECFISRRGGEVNKLPVLNENYPEDASVMQSIGGAVGFSILILEHGRPAEYTYQWYVNGTAVDGATSATYIKNTESAGICTIYCEITNKAGTVTSRIATLSVESSMPTYSYNGNVFHVPEDENNVNWNLQFLSSGTFLVDRDVEVDIHLVGGGGSGGGGWYDGSAAGGGGGGYTNTQKRVTLTAGTQYNIVIGAGGAGGAGSNGGSTSAFNYSAGGGACGGMNGGSGGTGGAAGGNAGSGKGADGIYAFNDSTFQRYGGGGGGGGNGGGRAGGDGGAGGGGKGGEGFSWSMSASGWGISGGVNTGGGGGGAGSQAGGNSNGGGVSFGGGAGGSGIVIIRNAR